MSGRRALGVLGLYLAGQFVVAFVVGVVLVAAAVVDGTDPSDASAMAAVAKRIEGPAGVAGLLGGGLAIGALELRRRRRRDPAFRRAVGWTRARPAVVLGALVAGVVLAVAYLWIVGTLLPPKQDVTPGPLARMAASPGWQQQVWRLTALVLSPPIEEFLFRGVLLAGFAARRKKNGGILRPVRSEVTAPRGISAWSDRRRGIQAGSVGGPAHRSSSRMVSGCRSPVRPALGDRIGVGAPRLRSSLRGRRAIARRR